MKKRYLISVSFLLVSILLRAQNITVSGEIKDATTKEALIGVNIALKGNPAKGTNSDQNGNYSITVPAGSTLVYSYIGYKAHEENVGNRSAVNVLLHEDSEILDEVVVVGYGTMRKSDLTGSLTSVKGDKMAEFTVPNPIQALQGRAPGVVITNNTGEPEGNFTVRIRGVNSIQGNNDPLYIIDGMPANASSINSNDIQSVEILKDASATAIYGSRGANGVVLIVTKKGRTGGTDVTYDGSYGIQSVINRLDLMNGTEWATFYNEEQLNDTGKEYFTAEQVAAFGKGTDWQSLLFDSAPVRNHNISVSSGNENTQIYISGSAMLREGIIPNSKYDKFNIRSTINHAINDRFDVELISSYARTATNRQNNSGSNRGGSLFGSIYSTPPVLTPYNDDGTYRNHQLAFPFMSNALFNAINIINETSNKTNANLTNVNAAITYKPVKGLSLKVSGGIQNLDYRGDVYRTSKYLYGANTASVSHNEQTTLINENILNYNTTLNGKHRIDLMGGFTYQQYVGTSMGASGSGFISDAPETHQLAAASLFNTPSTGYSKWVLMSYLARANYSYMGKYLATVSFRSDGSSRYSEGDKWGYFPSVALAWRVSDESFMKDIKEQLSDLKLRLGYGETGSTAIDPYRTLNMLSQGKTPVNGDLYTFYAASTTLPSNLKWETTAQYNIGLDLALFDSRLRITADYYDKTTRDLLNTVSLPASSGYGATIRNIGKMSNKGFELMVEGDIFRSNDFLWTASANIAFNKNSIKELYEGEDIYGSRVGLSYIEDFINLVREGEPIGVFFTYKEDGYDENGILKYVDVDNNGTLNNEDKFITGNPHPDFTYGLNSDIAYKGFEFSFFFQGSQGNDIFNVSETANLDYGMGLNMRRDVLNSHWKASGTAEQNAAAKYPKLVRNQKLNYSDRYVEDGSYIRLKNVQLAYNLPVNKWKINNWLKGVKVYVSGQNLLTFTGYSGLDPEINSWGGNINIGLDYLTYPNVKTFTFGAKVQF
ncbi:MAG: TonB-dependent receptor [Tannerellaceae bacterium]|jgi:TonB-linked SusC/RagA family outer membrane protein|nr:TonB-dependent receptor [Tannerellaceae bacterium]